MDWLRRAGVAYRLRAVLLLLSFAIGSLLARDALLVQQTLLLRAEVQRNPAADNAGRAAIPAFEQPPQKPTVRPSGISRRMAINPWDPPDDDDEVDQDSDTVAAAHVSLAVLPPVAGQIAAATFVHLLARPVSVVARPRPTNTQNVSSRGPPV